MKDRLPELLWDEGGDEAVRAHVAQCESCARDLALLHEVRAITVTPSLDTARIAAAIPAYRAPAWRRAVDSPALRIAAVIVLVAGGATLLQTAPGGMARSSVWRPRKPRVACSIRRRAQRRRTIGPAARPSSQ
jgi:hypothetical protein